MMKLCETPWELEHRLKCKIHEANMNLKDGHHHKWFVASLLTHLRVVMSQQKIMTHEEALEISMRLHETSMQDLNLGIQKIHEQLQNLFLEMKSLKKDKTTRPEAHEEVWRIKCKGQVHDKHHYPVFMNYVSTGGPIFL